LHKRFTGFTKESVKPEKHLLDIKAGFSPGNFLWLKQEFDDLHREHAVIIKKLNDLHEEHLLILKKLGDSQGKSHFDYSVGPVEQKT